MKLILIASAFLGISASAFVMPPSIFHVLRKKSGKVTISYPPSSSLSMAGFGGGASKKGGKKGKNKGAAQKLKPKSQWDKYLKMKKASSVKVAVRVSNEGSDAGEWYEVGKIKSENDEFTELAVVVQRGIIADHAKRLHPLQFLPKDNVEWGYESDDGWNVADRGVASGDSTKTMGTKVGFQGNPDPTGFYKRTSGKFAGNDGQVLDGGVANMKEI